MKIRAHSRKRNLAKLKRRSFAAKVAVAEHSVRSFHVSLDENWFAELMS